MIKNSVVPAEVVCFCVSQLLLSAKLHSIGPVLSCKRGRLWMEGVHQNKRLSQTCLCTATSLLNTCGEEVRQWSLFWCFVAAFSHRQIGPFLNRQGWSTGSFLTLMIRWWADTSQVKIRTMHVFIGPHIAALSAPKHCTLNFLWLVPRSAGPHHPHAVQSSSEPAGHNMVSQLRRKYLMFLI